VRVTLALLADHANFSREGKLNLLGIFDTIYASGFPTTHTHMQLVMRLEADAGETGTTHEVEVQLVASDGRVLFRLPGETTVARGEAGEPVRTDSIVNLANLAFESPGRYAFNVLIDGQLAVRVPLRVEGIPERH
jgi:hypothetical protein